MKTIFILLILISANFSFACPEHVQGMKSYKCELADRNIDMTECNQKGTQVERECFLQGLQDKLVHRIVTPQYVPVKDQAPTLVYTYEVFYVCAPATEANRSARIELDPFCDADGCTNSRTRPPQR